MGDQPEHHSVRSAASPNLPLESLAESKHIFSTSWRSGVEVLIFLILSFRLVEGNKITALATRNLIRESHLLSSINGSMLTTGDVITVLRELEKHSPLHLQILYDSEYEEATRYLSRILSSDLSGLMVFRYDGTVTTLNQMFDFGKTLKTHLLALCSSINILEIFQTIRAKRLESHFLEWILFTESSNRDDIVLALQKTVHEGTHVTIMTKEKRNAFLVSSIQVDDEGDMRFFVKGKWNQTDRTNRRSLPMLMSADDQHLYWDMRGRLMTMAAVDVIPYFRIEGKCPDGSLRPTIGTDVAILRALSYALNFTFRVVTPEDGAWGYPQPDGTVTGMIGMVARREVQFAMSGIAVNGIRESVIDYAYPYTHGNLAIYSNAPKEKNRALAVLTPFTWQVWMYFIGIILFMGPIMKVFSMGSKSFSTEKQTLDLPVYSFNMFRNVVNQGNLLPTKESAQRIVLVFWFYYCLIVTALYSGTLTAVLAIPSFEKPIDYLADLPRAKANGYTITTTRDSTNEYLFKEAKDGIYKVVWELFDHENRDNSFVDGPETAIARILTEKLVHICPVIGGRIYTGELGRSNFHQSKEEFFPQGDGIPMPQGAPYNTPFSYWLMRMNEGGLIKRWEKIEDERIAVESAPNKGVTKIVITLTHLQAAFFLMAIGYIIGTLVLFLEIGYSQSRFCPKYE
ncbi:glutamate receptor ionotropic, delta-2-like [Palaemon carinicauda]|uniref:glutamate receptor ionotropic, delta-2-like n=1 Tax=Palaemon carinicauda TaxID=392227 RepID=UPI0035B667E9